MKLFELSERGQAELAARKAAMARPASSPRRSLRAWPQTCSTALPSSPAKQFSDYDPYRDRLSIRTPSTPLQVSRSSRTPTPPRSAPSSPPLRGQQRMLGELCISIGTPRWLPADVTNYYVTATCLNTGEVKTSLGMRQSIARFEPAVDTGATGTVPLAATADRMAIATAAARSPTVRLPCAASSTIALHVVAVRKGITACEGGTNIALPHLIRLVGSKGEHAGGGQRGSGMLRIVAPLGIPVELAWQSDDDIIA